MEEITSAYDLTIKPHSQCLNQFPRSTESSLGAQHDAISESFSMAPVGLFLFLDGCVISLFTNPSIMTKRLSLFRPQLAKLMGSKRAFVAPTAARRGQPKKKTPCFSFPPSLAPPPLHLLQKKKKGHCFLADMIPLSHRVARTHQPISFKTYTSKRSEHSSQRR